jgi:hypothetical protein
LLLFLPLGALWLLLRQRRAAALALVVGAVLIVAPWTGRNYVAHGRVVLVAADGGVTFWTGNHPLAIGEGDMAANPAIKLDNQRLRAAHPGLSEEAMEPVYYREALAWVAQHPVQWLWLEARKVFYLIVPTGPSYTLHSARYYWATVVPYGLVLTLALLALPRLMNDLPRIPGVWLLAISAVLTSLIFFPQERFRIPVIDPTLIVLAAGGLARRHTRGLRPV